MKKPKFLLIFIAFIHQVTCFVTCSEKQKWNSKKKNIVCSCIFILTSNHENDTHDENLKKLVAAILFWYFHLIIGLTSTATHVTKLFCKYTQKICIFGLRDQLEAKVLKYFASRWLLIQMRPTPADCLHSILTASARSIDRYIARSQFVFVFVKF